MFEKAVEDFLGEIGRNVREARHQVTPSAP